MKRITIGWLLGCFLYLGSGTFAQADPCGMVTAPFLNRTTMIERVGAQKTYVFYKNGIESFVLRPGFKGRVDRFGMLIPFPTPPAIRKVPNEIFSHIAAAIDPPEVVIRVGFRRRRMRMMRPTMAKSSSARPARRRDSLSIHAVRVLRQEAVGMYQVAVLEAGSPKALSKWMKRNGFRYPKGMGKVIYQYIRAGWCFVVVKARIAGKKGLSPRPGMRKARVSFPNGGEFTGKVQAMGFRFRSRRLVVPMRLSAFNKGKLRNIVYLLTDRPKRIRRIPRKYVVRQIKGKEIYRNVTGPLPLRVIGGSHKRIPKWRWPQLQKMRNPTPHNGQAKNLFASDILAARRGKLSLRHERQKKVLLRIEENLNLRSSIIDRLNQKMLATQQSSIVKRALRSLRNMTLTIVDGEFPRKIIAAANLTFSTYYMPKKCNKIGFYHARTLRHSACNPKSRSVGQVVSGTLYKRRGPKWKSYDQKRVRRARRRSKRVRGSRYYYRLIKRLSRSKRVKRTLKKLIKRGSRAAPYLLGEAIEGFKWDRRGWSMVALSEIGGDRVAKGLTRIYNNRKEPTLFRYWAAAARIKLSNSLQELKQMSRYRYSLPALKRPIRLQLWHLARKESGSATMTLLKYAAADNYFQGLLQKSLAKQPPKELIQAIFSGKTTRIRQLAAAYASVGMGQEPMRVFPILQKQLRYHSRAKQVPWAGGALYLPSLPNAFIPRFNQWAWRSRLQNTVRSAPWNSIEKRVKIILSNRLVAENKWKASTKKKRTEIAWLKKEVPKFIESLLAWAIWAKQHKQPKEQKKIGLNLNHTAFAQFARYGVNRNLPILGHWLNRWGQAKGYPALKQFLKRMNVAHLKEYQISRIKHSRQIYFKQLTKSFGKTYKGCFRRLVYRRYKYIGYYQNTRTCRNRCSRYQGGYSHFALNNGSYCYCLVSNAMQQPIPELMCNRPCYKEPSKMCGGRGFSVYSIK